jgi:hypothetical protein
MKAKPRSNAKKVDGALQALRRAGKNAIELARLTGTPAYVLENGRIIDAAKRTARKRKKHGHA